MGGIGSGWYGRRTSRLTVDDLRSVDIRRLSQESPLTLGRRYTLEWTRSGCAFASIALTVEAGRVIINDGDVHYPVHLGRTACGAGERMWFLCPRCRRRCCLLYQCGGYACRLCLHLAYPIEREGCHDRAERRARKILNRVRFDPHRPDGKVAWRRWKTHRRLSALANEAAMVILERDDRLCALLRHAEGQKPKHRRGRPLKNDR